MAALRLLVLLLALALPVAARAATVGDWRPFSAEASQRFGVPIDWIERVMRVESGGRTTLAGRPIVSRAGAMGLMQLMPGTWAAMRDTLRLGPDPFDPHDNVFAGTFYLRLMYDRFGYPGCFAAYNAGPGRYAAWLTRRRPLPMETVAYLAAATGSGKAPASTPANAIFAAPAAGSDPAAPSRPTAILFAISPRH